MLLGATVFLGATKDAPKNTVAPSNIPRVGLSDKPKISRQLVNRKPDPAPKVKEGVKVPP